MIVGVNGGGKTTSLGKLAYRLKSEGATILLAAGDTFRQLPVTNWKFGLKEPVARLFSLERRRQKHHQLLSLTCELEVLFE